MSINLLETIQKNLGFPALHKIDPNTQEIKTSDSDPAEDRLSQAVIPSVLIALYNFSTTQHGAEAILNDNLADWKHEIFGNDQKEAILHIASYAHKSAAIAQETVNAVTREAVQIIRHELNGKETVQNVKTLLEDQRNIVLHYLPASVEIGKILNNTTFDDRTNKMEGPVSNLMHAIGNVFSSSDDTSPRK